MDIILKFARTNPWAGIAKYKNCKVLTGQDLVIDILV